QVTEDDGAEFAPDWAPDQAHVAISSREGAGAPVRISILDLATRTILPVTDPPPGFVDTEPGYSPDGTQIVFARGNVSTYHLALFVMNIDGTGLRQLTPWDLDADYPSWSPDGSTIVFQNGANCCEDPLSQIYTVKPDGTGL